MRGVLYFIFAILALARAAVYFQEKFDDGDAWEKRWIESPFKGDAAGKMKLSAGKFYADAEKSKGLQTSEDSRFYIYSAEIPTEFSNKDKKLILQYTVKHEQNIDCGGGYLKLLPKDAFSDPKEFTPDSKYNIMFGPDICGSTKKTHVIFSHDGTYQLFKKQVGCDSDDMTVLYSLIVNPDNTYEVKIDDVKVQSGNLEDDWDMVPPKMIQDPKAKKPADWVDDPDMDDPEDKKPEGWDDVPERIPDPDATKPEDWDDETDGEWEAPTIENPEYKGEWHPKRIPNPAYKGAWVHPMIENPDYKEDKELYAYPSFKYVGIEIWQVKAGTIFDNILITDDAAEAEKWAKEFEEMKELEKEAKRKMDEPAEEKEADAEVEAEEKEAEPEAEAEKMPEPEAEAKKEEL